MTQVEIKANVRCLGLDIGDSTTVEYTEFIANLVDGGKVSLTGDTPELELDLNEMPGEYDATHGEADPDPDDPDDNLPDPD